MKRLTLLSAVLAVVLSGCGQEKQGPAVKAGVVDTVRILNEMPEYRDLNLDWVRQTGEFYDSLPRDRQQLKDPKQLDAVRSDLRSRSETWQKRSDDFFRETYDRIKAASEEVAREKGLDLVVVDTPYVPAVQYSAGDNITTDVLLRLNRAK
ncbi:MAG: hypothetical protein AB1758_06200 [Candidatus Eremiobacterota bacterium]